MEWTDQPIPGQFGVLLKLYEQFGAAPLSAGASGVAAVYTDRAQAILIVHKVVVRMNSWLRPDRRLARSKSATRVCCALPVTSSSPSEQVRK